MTTIIKGKLAFSPLTSFLMIVAIIFFVRSIYTTPPELHDVRKKWHVASEIAEQADPMMLLSVDHHSSRWGVTIPTALSIKLGGKNILTYYTLLLLMYAIGFAVMMQFARPILEFPVYLLFGVLLFYEPMFFRATSQLQPYVFGFFYITASLYLLCRYTDQQRFSYLLAAGIFAFFAYGAKESYVFFVPGMLTLLWMRIGFAACIKFSLVLFAFLLMETLLFNTLDPQLTFGRIEFLFSGVHLEKMSQETASHYIDFVMEDWLELPLWKQMVIMILKKWLLLPPIDQILVAIGSLFSCYLLISKKLASLSTPSLAVILAAMSYAILVSLVPSQINPLLPLQPLLEKYLTVVLPFFVFTACLGLNVFLHAIGFCNSTIMPRVFTAGVLLFLLYAIAFDSPFKYRFRAIDYPEKYAMFWIEDDLKQAVLNGNGICETKSTTIIKILNLFHNYLNEDNLRSQLHTSTLENVKILHHRDYPVSQLTGYLSDRNLGQSISREQCLSKVHH